VPELCYLVIFLILYHSFFRFQKLPKHHIDWRWNSCWNFIERCFDNFKSAKTSMQAGLVWRSRSRWQHMVLDGDFQVIPSAVEVERELARSNCTRRLLCCERHLCGTVMRMMVPLERRAPAAFNRLIRCSYVCMFGKNKHTF
jgi:hypothetical protein